MAAIPYLGNWRALQNAYPILREGVQETTIFLGVKIHNQTMLEEISFFD